MRRRWTPERRRSFRITTGFAVYYGIFLLFIYGPMIAMFILSFQGRRGGTSFPMRGWSFHWWQKLILRGICQPSCWRKLWHRRCGPNSNPQTSKLLKILRWILRKAAKWNPPA